jgi:hypothetical protein
MTTEPGDIIRHLLIDAVIHRGGYGANDPIVVVDIVGNYSIVLWLNNEGEEELVSIPITSLLKSPVVIEPTDAAWAEYRARRFKASLVPADA